MALGRWAASALDCPLRVLVEVEAGPAGREKATNFLQAYELSGLTFLKPSTLTVLGSVWALEDTPQPQCNVSSIEGTIMMSHLNGTC